MKRRYMRICSVAFDSIDHNLGLVLFQKELRLRSILGEVDQKDVAKDGDYDGNDAFPDEDP